jgi:hypothetical protein
MTTLLEVVEARVEHEHMRYKQEDHRQQDQDREKAGALSIRGGTDSTTQQSRTERNQKLIRKNPQPKPDHQKTNPAPN